ncbi:NTP transferase domain-containing protein [Vibrio alginolyticus]|uniref:nucleotidyltransferase family protein n=1 Tax=Vibrio alginolyticus TaxID=663 RepID=UPI001BD360B0|nr:NTP transferase domain-containing protein [Vibrio alginolyticus]HDU8577881.1 NTP transferase domain-containing protein [Vibrio diabolicus]
MAHGVRTLAADYDAICITRADQITLRSEDFNQLISSSPPGHIVCSCYKRKRGIPALFPPCCFNQLIQLKGEFGARDLLRRDNFPVSEISLPYAEHDIDTKKELFELRRFK